MALEDEARDALLKEIKDAAPRANHSSLRNLAEAFALVTGRLAAPVGNVTLADQAANAVSRKG